MPVAQWMLAVATASAVMAVVPVGLLLKNNRAVYSTEMRAVLAFQQAPRPMVVLSRILADIYSPAMAVPLLVVLLLFGFIRDRDPFAAFGNAFSVGAPLAVVLLVKIIVDRNRPGTLLGSLATDPSFPSGHTACAVEVSAMLLMLIHARHGRGERRPIRDDRHYLPALDGLLIALPMLVAVSRLILGVHYPSDVITSLILCALMSASLHSLTATVPRPLAP